MDADSSDFDANAFWEKLNEALWHGYDCIKTWEQETADPDEAEANDFVFLCQCGITPDVSLGENNDRG